MKRDYQAIIFRAKAVLCLLLTANVCIWGLGCGQVGYSMLGEVVIQLTEDHPLTSALKGSEFEGATAIVVNPGMQTFRLIFPDEQRGLSGTYVNAPTAVELTSITLTTAQQTATLQLGTGQRVTQIVSTIGSTWWRPAEWDQTTGNYATAPKAPAATGAPSAPSAAKEITTDAYAAANAELLGLAQQLDAENGYGDSTVKADQSSFFWAAGALLHLVFVPGGIWATLVFIFQVVTIVAAII